MYRVAYTLLALAGFDLGYDMFQEVYYIHDIYTVGIQYDVVVTC